MDRVTDLPAVALLARRSPSGEGGAKAGMPRCINGIVSRLLVCGVAAKSEIWYDFIMDELFTSTILFLILVWTLPWKGIALWRAVRNGHKKWFIALLVLNTLAILEIVYIFYFSKPKISGGPTS